MTPDHDAPEPPKRSAVPTSAAIGSVTAALLVAMLVAALSGLVFFTGNKQVKPKLGIDLQGGTRVVLTARTPNGAAPDPEVLQQSQQIISARVNGLGVSGSEVVIDGQNLVITVPGNDGNEARNLGQLRRFEMRPVIHAIRASRAASPQEGPQPGGPPGAIPGVPPGAGVPPSDEDVPLATRVQQAKRLRQSGEQVIQILALQLQATRCGEEDVLAGNDDPNLPLVTCSTDGQRVFLLDKSLISGEEIKNATSGLAPQSTAYVVDLQFKDGAADTWAEFTAQNIGTQIAFMLDSQVVSAPQIAEAIPVGRTQIARYDPPFTADSARRLANELKYGPLPLAFEASEAQPVPATVGLTALWAALIGGAVGIALVLLYYRLLGLIAAVSLIVSGAVVFAILVLLGRYINYALDLAGITGMALGIATAATSFVVLFESIKRRSREDRPIRSAMSRGWARVRTTILALNAVTLLAAGILYFLAADSLKSLGFTLGLTTIVDIVVAVIVAWPLLYLTEAWAPLAEPAFSSPPTDE